MRRCLVCGGELINSKLKGLVECKDCGFITTDILLSEDEIKKLYSEGYYNGEEYDDYLRDEKMISRQFSKRLDTIDRLCSGIERVLEIGCAYGFFLREASKRYKYVQGIDVSETAVRYAKEELGMNACCGDFYSEFSDTNFDLVCLWDTIEHIQNPDKYIEKIGNIQNKNGYICITTGDIGSMNAKIRGRKWRQIHPPTHLHYFSIKSITQLLRNNGYEVIYKTHIPTVVNLQTAFYTILCIKSDHKKLWSILSKLRVFNLNVRLKLFDYMFVIARKMI